MPTFPEPWSLLGRLYGLSDEAAIAVPLEVDIALHRLVRNDPPTSDDFAEITRSRAERQGIEEIFRTGLSHFLTAEQARQRIWRDDQRIGRFVLESNPRIHVARTDRHQPGHLDVWMPADVIEQVLGTIEIVE